jgi:hypothetical protein
MYIIRNLDPEEPIASAGYICKFAVSCSFKKNMLELKFLLQFKKFLLQFKKLLFQSWRSLLYFKKFLLQAYERGIVVLSFSFRRIWR